MRVELKKWGPKFSIKLDNFLKMRTPVNVCVFLMHVNILFGSQRGNSRFVVFTFFYWYWSPTLLRAFWEMKLLIWIKAVVSAIISVPLLLFSFRFLYLLNTLASDESSNCNIFSGATQSSVKSSNCVTNFPVSSCCRLRSSAQDVVLQAHTEQAEGIGGWESCGGARPGSALSLVCEGKIPDTLTESFFFFLFYVTKENLFTTFPLSRCISVLFFPF